MNNVPQKGERIHPVAAALDSGPEPVIRLLHEIRVDTRKVDLQILRMAHRAAIDMTVDVPLVHAKFDRLDVGWLSSVHALSEQTAPVVHYHAWANAKARIDHVEDSTNALGLVKYKKSDTLFTAQAKY